MIVKARERPARSIDLDSFADLTPIPVSSIDWVADGVLAVEFASDLTPAVASAVQQRIESRNLNEETLRNQAIIALQNNRADIATNEQWLVNNPAAPAVTRALVEQSTRQARQINGIIRQLLGLLDGTD